MTKENMIEAAIPLEINIITYMIPVRSSKSQEDSIHFTPERC